MILDVLSEAAILRVFYIIKTCFNIICILVPIIIILTSIKTLVSYMLDSNGDLKNIRIIISKILVGMTIFFIPTIINSFFDLLDGNPNAKVIEYYNRASIEEVKKLEAKEKEEANKKRELAYAKMLENKKNKEAEKQKLLEQSEATIKENEENSSYSDNASGEYGVLKVENGVFYLPNKRATSSSDIPRQSGKHGLNPIFWERLSKLIEDGTKLGYKITVSSGWRSYQSQVDLWNNSSRPCSSRTSWVSCPGGSRHGFGIAADLKFNGSSCKDTWNCNSSAKWVHDNAAKYGLKFRLSNEPWHIEPIDVKGGNFGKCTASC